MRLQLQGDPLVPNMRAKAATTVVSLANKYITRMALARVVSRYGWPRLRLRDAPSAESTCAPIYANYYFSCSSHQPVLSFRQFGRKGSHRKVCAAKPTMVIRAGVLRLDHAARSGGGLIQIAG